MWRPGRGLVNAHGMAVSFSATTDRVVHPLLAAVAVFVVIMAVRFGLMQFGWQPQPAPPEGPVIPSGTTAAPP